MGGYLCTHVNPHVAANNAEPLRVAMQTQELNKEKHFVLPSTVETYLRFHVHCPITEFRVSGQIFLNPPTPVKIAGFASSTISSVH